MDSNVVRALVEDYYDVQDVRIRSNSRIRAFKDGVSPQKILEVKEMTGDPLILIEKQIKKKIRDSVKECNIWTEWLDHIKGIGPILAGGLIANIGDIGNFDTISKLWRYSGLAVGEDGRAERRKRGEKLHYNPRVKVLCWKIGESFVKGGEGYRELYETFREEYDEKWKTPEDCGSKGCKNKGKGKCMKGHRYAAAKRKTVKVFLAHLYTKWRQLEKLKVRDPFIIGKTIDGVSHGTLIPIVEE